MTNRPTCQELEQLGARYMVAYLAHDPMLVPLAPEVRFSENNVEMPFPDASWDTVTTEVGTRLILSDPHTGHIGIFACIIQNDTQGYLAVRLGVKGGLIHEIEHILSTARNLSGPPTPIGDIHSFVRDPRLDRPVDEAQRTPRAAMIAHADGYFATLANNDGEIRGTRFLADARRIENGKEFPEIEKGFRLGRYRFNQRVRRDHILVDEARGIVMSRGFIDHKGVLDEYVLTDGTKTRSLFREPHSWCLLEIFKIEDDRITAVEAVFIAVPYNMRSPWS